MRPERPLQVSFAVTEARLDTAMATRAVAKLAETDQATLRATLTPSVQTPSVGASSPVAEVRSAAEPRNPGPHATPSSAAQRLPNPTLLRTPTLRREAQATPALEGAYPPLGDVLTAGEETPVSGDLREILNYVRMADHAFGWVADGRPLAVGMLEDLQSIQVDGTSSAGPSSGRVRDIQVAIGTRPDAGPGALPIRTARFVPPPPGDDLAGDVRVLLDWMRSDHTGQLDPVVACAVAHHQFEALHPFHDGIGRIGRLLVVLHLHATSLLTEPTLTISPWFEARRADYYDRLLGVSTRGDWDGLVDFLASGLRDSADLTHRQSSRSSTSRPPSRMSSALPPRAPTARC